MENEATAAGNYGKFLWQDLTVVDAERIRDFYCQVIGWGFSGVSMGDYEDYNVMPKGSTTPVAGICHARGQNAGLPAQWLMYVSVPDIGVAIERCQQLGGQVLDGPRALGGSRFCVIRDPAGACLALFQESSDTK